MLANNETIKLSSDARRAVRKAVTAHASWKAWSRNSGITAADIRVDTLINLCEAWNIDYRSIARDADAGINADAEAKRAAERELMREALAGEHKAAETPKVETPKAAPINPANAGNDVAKMIEAMSNMFGPMVASIVDAKLANVIENLPKNEINHTFTVQSANAEIKIEERQHPLFETLLKALMATQANGKTAPIWISGPTGSGKTHAAEVAARALNVPFYFNGALAMAHELVGFVDAAGNYHTTPFRQAFEHGGVYLFDEVDASDNSALLALNAALANGVASFPDKAEPIKRHPDFKCIGAANTFGQGATAEFIGRAKIDAAFLSRFPIKIAWGYDPALEQAISGNVEFAKRVQAARARAEAAGVKIVIDPRHSMAGAALIAAGFTSDEAANLTYLAALKPEQVRIVEGR